MQKSGSLRLQTVSVLFTFLFVLVASVPAWGDEYVSVKKDGVNLRAAANTSAEILWSVFEGFPLQVLQRQGEWTQVKDFEGDKGWIYSPLLGEKQAVIVKVKFANMRSGPGKNYELVAKIEYGVVLAVIKREEDWVQLRYEDGTEGWVFSSLLWP